MEERSTVTIHDENQVGEVRIADEVVAIIASLAADEVEGVECIGNMPMTGRKNKRNLSRGIQIDITENEINCDIQLTLDYGVKIPEVSEKIQGKVKNAIENMTGLHVKEVNLHILGIKMPKSE